MKIQDILLKNHIVLDMDVDNKTDLLTILGKFLCATHSLENPNMIIQKIFERENDYSTGIGYGIAIPHCRLEMIDKPYIVAGRTIKPIEYDAIDDQPVSLVFMMVSPVNTSTDHSQILTALSKIMVSEETRRQLLQAKDIDEFTKVLADRENKIDN